MTGLSNSARPSSVIRQGTLASGFWPAGRAATPTDWSSRARSVGSTPAAMARRHHLAHERAGRAVEELHRNCPSRCGFWPSASADRGRAGTGSRPFRRPSAVGTVGLPGAQPVTSAARCLQRRVVGIDGHGEAGVALGVFMAAADEGVARELGQFLEAGEHLGGRALEHPAAAEAEQGVGADQDVALGAEVADVAARVAGRVDHLDVRVRRVRPCRLRRPPGRAWAGGAVGGRADDTGAELARAPRRCRRCGRRGGG